MNTKIEITDDASLDAEGMKLAAFAVFAKANAAILSPEKIKALWPSQHHPHWDGLAEAAIRAYLPHIQAQIESGRVGASDHADLICRLQGLIESNFNPVNQDLVGPVADAIAALTLTDNADAKRVEEIDFEQFYKGTAAAIRKLPVGGTE